jgi:peptidylprolyl isomerase
MATDLPRRRNRLTWRLSMACVAVLAGQAACSPGPEQALPTPAPDASSVGPIIEVDTTGDPPADLTITDLTDGSGPVAEEGDLVRISYVGRGWRSGVPIGAWESPLFEFRLGEGSVIEGFDQGIGGMAEGGRRRIIVPPAFAYGQSDLGQLTGDTLVFVVELVDVVS